MVLVVSAVFCSASLLKHWIEKQDEQYTGRQIVMDWAYVNPLTGYVHLANIKVFEPKSDSIFCKAEGLTIYFNWRKIWSKTYEISAIELEKPVFEVTQTHKSVNFGDLITRFSSKDSIKNKEPLQLNVLGIKISDGEIHYRDTLLAIDYGIKKVNIESAGFRWDSDTLTTQFSFASNIGEGNMKGNFNLNLKNKAYRLGIEAHQFDLQIIEQYLKSVSNDGHLSANLDANIVSTGNLLIQENVTNKGTIVIHDFHLGKSSAEDDAFFEKLTVQINEVSPKKAVYSYDTVALLRPYFQFERYNDLNNLEKLFGKNGNKYKTAKADTTQFNLVITIANYLKMLGENLFKSDYVINHLAIDNGCFKYNDYTQRKKFSMALNPLNVVAEAIHKQHFRSKMSFKAKINPFGHADIALSINPKNPKDFDLQYHFLDLPISMFNPYIVAYTSFPFDGGTLDMNGDWHVINGKIKSKNHLLIIKPHVNQHVIKKNKKWLPIRLIMAFIRNRGNVINYQIPISGSLDNPKFHWYDASTDLIKDNWFKRLLTPKRVNKLKKRFAR